MARGLSLPLPALAPPGQSRPPSAQPGAGADRPPRAAPAHRLCRRLRRVRAGPAREDGALGEGARQAGRQAAPHAGLRRPLPLQGEQGAPGAEPAQGDCPDGADPRGDRGARRGAALSGAKGAAAAFDHPRSGRCRLRHGGGPGAARSQDRSRRSDRAARRQRQRQVDLRQAARRAHSTPRRRDRAGAQAAGRLLRPAPDRGAAARAHAHSSIWPRFFPRCAISSCAPASAASASPRTRPSCPRPSSRAARRRASRSP